MQFRGKHTSEFTTPYLFLWIVDSSIQNPQLLAKERKITASGKSMTVRDSSAMPYRKFLGSDCVNADSRGKFIAYRFNKSLKIFANRKWNFATQLTV